jgi:hypothetical protein
VRLDGGETEVRELEVGELDSHKSNW